MRKTDVAQGAVQEYLQAVDMAALERFEALCEDGEGYDMPPKTMTRLATLGVLRHVGWGRYEVTAFGLLCLGSPLSRLPLETAIECNARLSAEHCQHLAALGGL